MKVTNHNNYFASIGWLIFMLVIVAGCYESRDACIDSRATNYDVSGDINCCCEYPILSLGIGFFYEGIGFRTNQVYTKGDDSFKIIALDMLISEVALLKSGDSSRVDTMILLPTITGGPQNYFDDFAHLEMSSASEEIGRFMIVDTFDALRFTIGLNDAKMVDPQNISTAHPLHQDRSNWTEAEGYVFMNMTLLRGAGLKDTLMLRIGGDVNRQSIELIIKDKLISERGEDILIDLEFNVSNWIEGLDIINDDPTILIRHFYTQLPDVIKLKSK